MDRKIWKKRWMRALVATYFLRFVPYVRFIGLNGSMVTGLMHEESDIDFFVVLEKDRIFTGRFLVAALTQIMGIRRHGKRIAGRICLNRFSTTDHLRITPENSYHARVFHNIMPLFDSKTIYTKYISENGWMNAIGFPIYTHTPVFTPSLFSKCIQYLLEACLTIVVTTMEHFLKERQYNRFATDSRVKLPGSRVIITDFELCFHLAKDAE